MKLKRNRERSSARLQGRCKEVEEAEEIESWSCLLQVTTTLPARLPCTFLHRAIKSVGQSSIWNAFRRFLSISPSLFGCLCQPVGCPIACDERCDAISDGGGFERVTVTADNSLSAQWLIAQLSERQPQPQILTEATKATATDTDTWQR